MDKENFGGARGFHLEFTSFEDFQKFLALMNGAPVDEAEVAKLAKALKAEREALAGKAAQTTPKP